LPSRGKDDATHVVAHAGHQAGLKQSRPGVAFLLLMKFFSENHSGDVNNHSGRIGLFIHLSPESLFTSRRNPYSHHSGTIIHMPRNPQITLPAINWIARPPFLRIADPILTTLASRGATFQKHN
jgi:hypothetical protein